MSKASLTLAAALTAAVPAVATAQDSEIIDLGEIIVSGGLSPIEAENYGRSVSVVTSQELEERGIKTLQEALRGLPGVAVTSTGESLTQVRIRGGESNHVLFLIDGVEASAGGGGNYVLTGLTAADIERIEVLRGPQSVLYGDNALSGVISITTKRAEKPGTSYGGGVEIGSNSTRAANAYVRQKFDRGELNFSLDARHTDGEDGSRLDGGDTEFNDRETINLTGRYAFSDTVTAGFSARRSWQHYGYEDTNDSFFTPPQPATAEGYLVESPVNATRYETFGSLWAEAESASGRSKHRLTLSSTDQDNEARDSASDFGCCFSNDSTQRSAQYTGNFSLDGAALQNTAHQLNLLAEYEQQTYQSSFGSGEVRRSNRAVAAEYLGELASGLDLQLGVRQNFNDSFEDATSWNLSMSYQVPNSGIRLRGAAGQAFVNPTMTELFGFFPGSFTGNTNLEPEESRSYELGADIDLGGIAEIGATVYRTKVDNLIQGSGMTAVNIAGASRAEGVELEARADVLSWLELSGAYTYTDAETATGGRQQNRPQHELRLSALADAFAGRGTVSVDLRHISGSYGQQFFLGTFPAPLEELPDFTTVDLAATYEITATTQLTARVMNLFDEDYQESWGYFANGREIFVGLSAAF